MTITIKRMGNCFAGKRLDSFGVYSPKHDYAGMDEECPGGFFEIMPDCIFDVTLELSQTMTGFRTGFYKEG